MAYEVLSTISASSHLPQTSVHARLDSACNLLTVEERTGHWTKILYRTSLNIKVEKGRNCGPSVLSSVLSGFDSQDKDQFGKGDVSCTTLRTDTKMSDDARTWERKKTLIDSCFGRGAQSHFEVVDLPSEMLLVNQEVNKEHVFRRIFREPSIQPATFAFVGITSNSLQL